VPRPSHREKILSEGMRVIHERGFAGSSIRDIIQAAGVPQGSFTNHFASKEAFGLAVLNAYYGQCRELTEKTLLNDALPPLRRLRAWVDAMLNTFNQNEEWNGCMLGNFGAEHSSGTNLIQERVREIFHEIQQNISYCLKAAVKAGELPRKTDCDELAGFIHASMEGAVLSAKAIRSLAPMKSFKHILFSSLLKQSAIS
jgi:TetR/AcrR family transcriptional repressor of nem operon